MIYVARLKDNFMTKEKHKELYPKLQALLTKLDIEHTMVEHDGTYSPLVELPSSSLYLSAEQYLEFELAGISLDVQQKIDISKLMGDQFKTIEGKQQSLVTQDTYNSHCEVHIPGFALSTYNDTLLLEDSCTDQLQEALDKGWRIIACCPQAQRRPDYILGRYNPDSDLHRTAKRSNQI